MSDTSAPVDITLTPITEGDTWQGIASIGPVTINGDAPASELASMSLHFVRVNERLPSIKIGSTGVVDAPIVIDNAATWEAHIPIIGPSVFNLKQGDYVGSLRTVDAAGVVLTLYTLHLTVRPEHY